jgi:GT2 family glycosyltransferase
LDRAHETARWHPRGKNVVPVIDDVVTKPFRHRIQRVKRTDFLTAKGGGWHQNLPDIYVLQRWKVLGSLSTSLIETYDYIYFTTASSYVRVDELLRRISMLPSTGVYAGTRMTLKGDEFASGASRILSRDVVEEVLRQRHRYPNDVMEDVGLGRLLRQVGVELIPLPSLNIASMGELQSLTDEQLHEHFHFRLTSGTRKDRQDVDLMHALDARLPQPR